MITPFTPHRRNGSRPPTVATCLGDIGLFISLRAARQAKTRLRASVEQGYARILPADVLRGCQNVPAPRLGLNHRRDLFPVVMALICIGLASWAAFVVWGICHLIQLVIAGV